MHSLAWIPTSDVPPLLELRSLTACSGVAAGCIAGVVGLDSISAGALIEGGGGAGTSAPLS